MVFNGWPEAGVLEGIAKRDAERRAATLITGKILSANLARKGAVDSLVFSIYLTNVPLNTIYPPRKAVVLFNE